MPASIGCYFQKRTLPSGTQHPAQPFLETPKTRNAMNRTTQTDSKRAAQKAARQLIELEDFLGEMIRRQTELAA